jgi:hypothetical protein
MKARWFAAAVMVMLVVGLSGAPASAQGAAPNQIVVRAQETNTGQVMIDSVTAAQDGWVVLYFMGNLDPLAVVGYAPVRKGVSTNVKVNIESELAEPYGTMWAVLHVDQGAVGVFEWPGGDTPVYQNGAPVMASFGTQAPSATAPAASSASAAAQTTAPGTTAAPPRILPVAGAGQPLTWLALIVAGAAALAAGVFLSRRQYQRR